MSKLHRVVAGFLSAALISSAFPVSAVVDSCVESLCNNSAVSESSDFANTDATDNLVFGDDNTPLVSSTEDTISTAGAAVIHPIYTAQDLQNINQDLSGSYYLANDIDLAESDCLPDDPNNNFVSIGTEEQPFTGTFDGRNHMVKNLQISTDSDYVGLFAYVGTRGRVSNVGVSGSITATENAAGVVGYLSSMATVSNCWNEASIVSSQSVGGVVYQNDGFINNCYNIGTVSGQDTSGGVIGYSSSTVTNCNNQGAVTGVNAAGGVVGNTHGVVSNSYNSGAVESKLNTGGVAGNVADGGSNIFDCYNTGDLTGQSDRVGGVAGCLDGNATMMNCYNTGDIYAAGTDIGGIIGFLDEKASMSNCYNAGAIYGDSTIGGIVGKSYGVVNNCYYNIDNAGDIKSAFGIGEGLDVLGLTRDEMTGPNALDKMVFTAGNAFQAPPIQTGEKDADGNVPCYFPQLSKFCLNTQDIACFPYIMGHDFDGEVVFPGNYTVISCADDLRSIRENLSGYYLIVNDIDLTEGTESLQPDVSNFIAIGTSSAPFIGKIDGQGYSIYNLQIYTDEEYQGLFGYVGENAWIANLTVTGTVAGGKKVGGVAGFLSKGASVLNCCNRAAVSGSEDVGGVVGKTFGSLTNCANYGAISNQGGNIIGGVTGYLVGNLTNCYNVGDVSGNLLVGGVAGLVDKNGAITNIYNAASVTGSIFVGGVVGSLTGSINNAYYNTESAGGAHSAIGNNNGSSSSVLGLTTLDMSGPDALNHMVFTDAEGIWLSPPCQSEEVGDNGETAFYLPQLDFLCADASNPQSFPYIVGRFFNGDFVQTGDYTVVETADQLLNLENDLTGCYVLGNDIDASNIECTSIGSMQEPFEGKFDGQGHTVSNIFIDGGDNQGLFGVVGQDAYIGNLDVQGEVHGRTNVGGIVGLLESGATVENCHSDVSVYGTENVGGIAGNISSGAQLNCSANHGSVNGSKNVGGLVGLLSGSVDTSYNTGSVSGNGSHIGGLIGEMSADGASLQTSYNMEQVMGSGVCMGGIVGSVGEGSQVIDCYNAGLVKRADFVQLSDGDRMATGGVAGNVDGSVSNCYYNLELVQDEIDDAVGKLSENAVITQVQACNTLQMTGENAIGIAGMDFQDPTVWMTQPNEAGYVYYPYLESNPAFEKNAVCGYHVSFPTGDMYEMAYLPEYAADGQVSAQGSCGFTVTLHLPDYGYEEMPITVFANGAPLTPVCIEDNVYTYLLQDIEQDQEITIEFNEIMPSSIVVCGQNSMKYGEEQTLTVSMEPQDMLEKNRAVTWSIAEGIDNAEIVSSSNTNAVIRAVGVGEVTVRAEAANGLYDDFSIVVETTVESVQISGEDKVMQDVSSIFRAEVIGEQSPSQEVRWRIEGACSPNTTVFSGSSSACVLKIGIDETAETIEVVATSVQDPQKEARFSVSVVLRGDFSHDGVVDSLDKKFLYAHMDQNVYYLDPNSAEYDLNHDSVIDQEDMNELLKIFEEQV